MNRAQFKAKWRLARQDELGDFLPESEEKALYCALRGRDFEEYPLVWRLDFFKLTGSMTDPKLAAY